MALLRTQARCRQRNLEFRRCVRGAGGDAADADANAAAATTIITTTTTGLPTANMIRTDTQVLYRVPIAGAPDRLRPVCKEIFLAHYPISLATLKRIVEKKRSGVELIVDCHKVG